MEERKCTGCYEVINPLRIKALPHTNTCVNCSTTGPKKAISAQFGEKDHTWNEIVFMEEEVFQKYEKIQKIKPTFDKIEDGDEDEIEKEDEEEEEGFDIE